VGVFVGDGLMRDGGSVGVVWCGWREGGGLIPYNLVVKNLLSPSSGLLTTNVSN